MNKEIPQIETSPAWQCPYCGDWFTDGETRCGDCEYELKHIFDSGNCWCDPELEYEDPETGNQVWVHREVH